MKKQKNKRTTTLFRRYFIQITATVLSCLTLTSVAVLFFSARFWKKDRLTSLTEDALSFTQSVTSVLEGKNLSPEEIDMDTKNWINRLLEIISDSADAEMFMVSPEGKLVMCFDAGNTDSIICDAHRGYQFPEIKFSKENEDGQEYFRYKGRIEGGGNEDYFVVSVPLYVEGERYMVVALQSESVAYIPYTSAFLRILITVGILAVFISFIVSFSVSLKMTKPLKVLTEAANEFARGNFSVRIKSSDSYNELSELVEAANSMAASLSVLEESRSSFVANVSHELKTPMTTISGFIDGILDGTVSEKDTKKYLTIVSDEVKRLSRLVVAMLNMSKIQAGKLELTLTEFDLREILTRTLLSFEQKIDGKGISVDGFGLSDSSVIVADEALINQIIYNLIDNAVKFTPEGGTISIGLAKEKKFVSFSIRNTGKGIPPEECDLIFDRFYKVDKSRGLDAKSFGMGLYIVKSIIELHKGTITVSSEENSYTEFVVRLPSE